MTDLPTCSRQIKTAEEAVQALRMALGMAIQVIVSPDAYDEATKDHVRREAVATNLTTAKFDPRTSPPAAFVNLVQPQEYLADGTLPPLVITADNPRAAEIKAIVERHRGTTS